MTPTYLPVLLRRIAPETDAALIERYVRDRDEEAFKTLVERHGPMILGVCRRTLGNRHAAEDACQAVFLILARKARTLKPGELAGWLYAVARRTALKARRASPQPITDLPSQERDPLSQLTGRELLAILEDELQRLPAAYRLPIALCCIEGLTQEEAARRLNTTTGSIRGRVDRGRARLHARLANRGLTPAAVIGMAEFARGAIPSTAFSAASKMLAQEVLKSMFLSKFKILASVLLVLACGTGVLTMQLGSAAEEPKKTASHEKSGVANPDAPDWGETDKGVQIRLRPLKGVWAADETPSFEIDMRVAPNNQDVGIVNYQFVHRVEVDGEAYEVNPLTSKHGQKGGFSLGQMLEPGKDYGRVGTVSLGEFRPVKGESRPLKPGKHLIRMTGLMLVPNDFAYPPSKTVAIEIKEDAKKANATQRPSESTKLPKIHAQTTTFVTGENVVIRSDRELVKHSLSNGSAEQIKAKLAIDFKVDPIDWKERMLICIRSGKHDKGGMTIQVDSLSVIDGKLVIKWQLKEPEIGANLKDFYPRVSLLVDRFDGDVIFDPSSGK